MQMEALWYCMVPVCYKTLVLAKVTEKASIVQVHDSMLLSSDVHIHRQPVICQVALEGPEEKRWFREISICQYGKLSNVYILPLFCYSPSNLSNNLLGQLCLCLGSFICLWRLTVTYYQESAVAVSVNTKCSEFPFQRFLFCLVHDDMMEVNDGMQ